jgi:hypothetical protein
MTRKRFEKILMAFGFKRNELPHVCRAALRDMGCYENAIIETPIRILWKNWTPFPRELRRPEAETHE